MASLLMTDGRFSYSMMFGSIIFLKGNADITIKSFERYLVRKVEQIDAYLLQKNMTERYGCRIDDRLELVYKLQGTQIYYDRILERLYANADLYDRELDRAKEIANE